MTVGDDELDQTMRRIAQENKMTLHEFHNALEHDGVSFNKFRNEIRDEIILVRLKEREVTNRVSVTEGEVDNFLHTQDRLPRRMRNIALPTFWSWCQTRRVPPNCR